MTMNPLTLLRDTLDLFLPNIAWLYLEFLAARIAATTLFFLLLPMQAHMLMSGAELTSALFIFINGHSILSSLVFAIVGISVTKRLWRIMGGPGAAGPFGLAGWGPVLGVSVLVDHVVTAGILFLFLVVPGLILSAMTTTVMPALAIEQRGWGAIRRSVDMTRPYLVPLTIAWSAVLIPWIALAILSGGPAAPADTDTGELWVGSLTSSLYTPLFVGFGFCLSVTVYRQILEEEGGGSADRLGDIFK